MGEQMDRTAIPSRSERVLCKLSASTTHPRRRNLTKLQILQFSIYYPRTQSGPEENISYQQGERLWYFYGSVNIEEEVARLINNQCGAVAVAGECHRFRSHFLL